MQWLNSGVHLKTAKHQTRFKRFSQKMRSLSFIEWCLTKPVHPCKGLTDESHLVYLHPSTQCLQGLGHSPVTSRTRAVKKGFIGSFMLETALENTLALLSKTHKTTYKTLFECF
jgi:hypothetical protein